jgi:hypothetical protein
MELLLKIAASMVVLLLGASGCGHGGPADEETGPTCPAFLYIRSDACVPLPPFADATVPSNEGDAAPVDAGDAGSTEAAPPETAPAEALPVCTYDGASPALPDAGSSGPWITGTDVTVSGLARDPQGNVFVLGSSPTVSFSLEKFDPSGAALWTQPLGGTPDVRPTGIATDPAGSVVVVGTTSKSVATVDFGGGPLPAGGFVVKYDRDGRLVFQKMFPLADDGSSFPWMSQVRVLPSGDIVVAGSLQGTIDFGGGPLTAAGGISVFLARFGPCGAFVFARQYGATPNASSWTYGLAANAAGELLMTGIFEGILAFADGGIEASSSTGTDSFVAKFDALGNPIASRSFHSADSYGLPGVPALDDAGHAIVVGGFTQPIDLGGGVVTPVGSTDAYVAAYGPNLEYLWSLPFGDPAFQTLVAATIDDAGDIVVTGALSGSVTLGTSSLQVPDGGESLVVARLALDGGVIGAATATGESSGIALAPAEGTNVVLGGDIQFGPFQLGGEALETGPRGVIMKFAP